MDMCAASPFREFDLKLDCYCPPWVRYYRDFEQRSPSISNNDWFATHEDYSDGPPDGVSSYDDGILVDTAETMQAQPGTGAANLDAKQAESKPKKKNIVTSWGPAKVPKYTAEDGASEQRAAKAMKRKEHASAPRPLAPRSAAQPKVKPSKAAGAEGRREAAKERNALKVVKVSLKSKGKTLVTKIPRRFMPTRSTKKLTMPEDVELHTSKRAKAHAKDQVVGHHDDGSEGDTEDNKENSAYKPLVLRVKEFDKTPGRFKRKPDQLPPAKPLGITEAKEPQLLTAVRVRPSMFKPREVLEAEEMAHMPVFRASTLNPLILTTSGQLGVPKVDKRDVTEPRPFSFVTDDRAEAKAAARLAKQQEAQPHVKQQHQPEWPGLSDSDGSRKKLKNVAGHPSEPVVPRSPLLHTKFRARENKAEEQRYEFHARPVPKYLSIPSLELLGGINESAQAPTQPEPFRLATAQRGARYRITLEAKMAEEERAAQRARVPRANGLPLSTDMPLVPPKPEPRVLTVPEPFHLVSEVRHSKYEEQKRRALEEEEAAKRAEAEFRAKPMWKGIPFRVHDADVALTVPEPVNLHTSVRAVVREEFNKQIEEKWKENEAAAKQAEEEKRLREEEEWRHARKAAVFHALPMPDLSAPPAVKPMPPPKPLTQPKSPALATRKRQKLRNHNGA